MSLRQQVQASAETIVGFEAAAKIKYDSGFNLMATGDPGNGIYLMGFAAEMLLKSAYFRFIGFPPGQTITWNELDGAKRGANHLGVVAPPQAFHNLQFWSELIVKARQASARPLTTILETDLIRVTRRLSDNWFIDMRYLAIQGVMTSDLDDVFDDVSWIFDKHQDLWR